MSRWPVRRLVAPFGTGKTIPLARCMTCQADKLQQVFGLAQPREQRGLLRRSITDEAPLKPFSPRHEKRLKHAGCSVATVAERFGAARSMGIVMVTVLIIAVVVEVAIVIAEIATRARLVAHAFSSRRATH